MKLNHSSILKRAWHILWSYRVLWVFGIILALTTGGNGGNGGNSGATFSGDQGDAFRLNPPPEMQRELGEVGEALGRLFEQVFTEGIVPVNLIALGVGLACLGLLIGVVFAVARYVAENALIKMVDAYEEAGEMHTVGKGFRLGWSRSAFRQWLIGLVIAVPIAVAAIVAFAIALAPLLGWVTDNTAIGVLGTVTAIGLFFLVLMAVIVVATVASVVQRLAYRATSLADLGVFPSIRCGWQMLTGSLKEVGLMWLILFGIALGYMVVMIPVVLIVLAVAAVAGGLLFLGVSGVLGLLLGGAVRWIAGGILGGLLFITLFSIPMLFLGGLFEVFRSTVWTLTYRELSALSAIGDDGTTAWPDGDQPEVAVPGDLGDEEEAEAGTETEGPAVVA